MAKTTLPTNFQDDILNSSMGNKRRYNLIQNSDGTVSLEDVSTYDQVGSEYGAGQVNSQNAAINASADSGKIIDDIDGIEAATEKGYIAGALALKNVNNNLGGLKFGIDEDGNYGYIKAGADTVTPFKNADNTNIIKTTVVKTKTITGNGSSTTLTKTYKIEDNLPNYKDLNLTVNNFALDKAVALYANNTSTSGGNHSGTVEISSYDESTGEVKVKYTGSGQLTSSIKFNIVCIYFDNQT